MLRATLLVLRKELVVEWRTREILSTMLFFAIVVMLLFSFAFLAEGRASTDAVAGILCTATIFSGTLGLSRSADREREGDAFRALLLSPAPRAAIYLGKMVGMVLFMSIVEAALLALAVILFKVPVLEFPGRLAALFLLGTVGYAAVGSLFSLMLGRARSREMLLAALLYPIIVPVVIAVAKGTAGLLDPMPDLPLVDYWIRFLAVFDLVFLTVALWIFEPIVLERS